MPLRPVLTAAVLTAALLLSGCGQEAPPSEATDPGTSAPAGTTTIPEAAEVETTQPTTTDAATTDADTSDPDATAVLAFGGDVHFEGSSEAAITDGFGTAFDVLEAADVAVVNLETAITTGGQAAPKQFTFRAPPEALDALQAAGIEAVSLANNHGMDYGQEGLRDTLEAETASGLPIIGAGHDVDEAFAPWRTTVEGIDISVLAATDVLDSFAIDAWPATDDRPGLASSKDPARLVKAVEAEAASADIVAVMLHWGVEREVCPTARQRELADLLSAAGADVLVGSHAHVVQPDATVGNTYVHHGLGNFVWYARGGPGSQSGVAAVTVNRDGVVDSQWHPATISSGRPQLLEGADRDQRLAAFESLCD